MTVNENRLPALILQLQALVDFLGQKQAEASACLDRLSQIQKVPDANGRLRLPDDHGTGAPITSSRRNAIYDACAPDAEALLALLQASTGGSAGDGTAEEEPAPPPSE